MHFFPRFEFPGGSQTEAQRLMVLREDLDCLLLPFSLGKAVPQPSWVSLLSYLSTGADCSITELLYRVVMGDKPEEAVSSPLKCPQIDSPCVELSPTLLKAGSLNPHTCGVGPGPPIRAVPAIPACHWSQGMCRYSRVRAVVSRPTQVIPVNLFFMGF